MLPPLTQRITPYAVHDTLESDRWRVVVITVVIADVLIFALGGTSTAALVLGRIISFLFLAELTARMVAW